ncbi:hypothetical protein [Candidatus Mycoplasma haematominutum]|uniref:Uncharacterized protein n=1 Tax=Candidatus Mycoplasma haematominutum 'Birmingham 1' TaxID=1116213 RepID=G8C2S8_9MOLU|nr:hypothetical protein [Candidatus Mycoplasma haematominutum]CCE66626.1 hypothetical protein MHM_01080 [Candidatus Mycoplasma haematominutum 'Birmingham 1']
MAFYFRALLWLGVLGGALTGIGLPTNNAVQSIFNKQQVRKTGWHTQAGRDYESYWYGAGGFGDERTKTIAANGWENEIKTALTDIRGVWGKQQLGEGLEKKFESWLKTKSLCNNDSGSNNGECQVGNIEFIEEKDKSLFGRIPLKDKDGKKVNVYLKWMKCTNSSKNTKKVSGVWFGGHRKEGDQNTPTTSGKIPKKYNWCVESTSSK